MSTMPLRNEDGDYADSKHVAQASSTRTSTRKSGRGGGVDWFEQYYNAGDEDDDDDENDLFPENIPPKPTPIIVPTTTVRNNEAKKSSLASPPLPRPTATAVKSADRATSQPKAASSFPKPTSTFSVTAAASSASLQESKPATVSVPDTAPASSNDELLHPHQFLVRDETTGQLHLPHPKSLSPSSIKEFLACPQSFLFQYILGLRQPTNAALAKGSMCHAALERVFDLEPEQRDLTTLQNLFRTAWSEHRRTDAYKDLFGQNVEQEAAWGREGLQLLENYWRWEDAAQVSRPNPVQREVWVSAALPLDPARGVTAAHNNNNNNNIESEPTETFLVRGIVDRLDMVQSPNDKQVALRLIDYKSGKKPDLKYSPAMNAKIREEALEQLLIYALLLRESGKNRENPMPLRYLRLLYLTSRDGTADVLELDMGATAAERDARLNAVHEKLARVWRDVGHLIDQVNENIGNVDAKSTTNKSNADQALLQVFEGCQRTFCYCHKCRPRFQPGTVWEP